MLVLIRRLTRAPIGTNTKVRHGSIQMLLKTTCYPIQNVTWKMIEILDILPVLGMRTLVHEDLSKRKFQPKDAR